MTTGRAARSTLTRMGPLQMLVVGFDGSHFKGEIAPELSRLKREGIVRIVDLLLVRKEQGGTISVLTSSDLDWEEAVEFGEYAGALAGVLAEGGSGGARGSIAGAAELMDGHLFDEDNEFELERGLPEGWSAALVLFEHLWAEPLLNAVWRAGGLQLANEWVTPEQLIEVPAPAEQAEDDAGL